MTARAATDDFFEHDEPELVQSLVAAHHLVAMLGLDDLTYTHISVRSRINHECYYIARLGPLFSQVKSEDIIKLSLEGKFISGPYSCNITGQNLYGALYRDRPDVHAALHTHTPDVIAVASLEGGLANYSQFSMVFYERVGYFPYDGLALEKQGVLSNSAQQVALLMESHGAITMGKTLHEALFYALFLEKAAQVQLKMMATGIKPIIPSPEVSRRARDQMIAFEPDLGRRDWEALLMRLHAKRSA